MQKSGEKMSIIRVVKNRDYVVMNKTALHDPRLSWKAKGLHAYMLSMPDDWTFYNNELINHAKDGKDSFKSAMKELQETGYVKRKRKQNEEGKFDGWETIVYEIPSDGETDGREIRQSDNPQLLNNKDTKELKELNNKEKDIPYFEIIKYLNEKTNSNYRHTTKKTKDLIKARWNEGFTLEDFKTVIDKKTAEWLNDPKMSKYLRPETLFGTKFESYLNQKEGRKPVENDQYANLF